MDCDLTHEGPHEDGRQVYRCRNCALPIVSRQTDPRRIHRQCQAQRTEVSCTESLVQQLPAASQQLLIGDRIKQLTDALGIPQCGGCAARQAWLNDAHRWVLGMWGAHS